MHSSIMARALGEEDIILQTLNLFLSLTIITILIRTTTIIITSIISTIGIRITTTTIRIITTTIRTTTIITAIPIITTTMGDIPMIIILTLRAEEAEDILRVEEGILRVVVEVVAAEVAAGTDILQILPSIYRL
jgi:hypothetical protein